MLRRPIGFCDDSCSGNNRALRSVASGLDHQGLPYIFMELNDIITTIAEIAIALVGFSAIVVVLNPTPIREWASSDQVNFRVLVQLAAVVAFFSILPFGTHLIFDEAQAWKYALLIYGIYHFIDLASFVFRFPHDTLRINRSLPLIGFIIAIFQVLIPFIGNTSAVQFTYLTALVWHLIVSFISFVILVYGVREERDT